MRKLLTGIQWLYATLFYGRPTQLQMHLQDSNRRGLSIWDGFHLRHPCHRSFLLHHHPCQIAGQWHYHISPSGTTIIAARSVRS